MAKQRQVPMKRQRRRQSQKNEQTLTQPYRQPEDQLNKLDGSIDDILTSLDVALDEYLSHVEAAGPSAVVGQQQPHQQVRRPQTDESLIQSFRQTTGE